MEAKEERSAAASILSNWGEAANLLALFSANEGTANLWIGRSMITWLGVGLGLGLELGLRLG